MTGARTASEMVRLDPAVVRLIAVTDTVHDGVDALVGRAVKSVRGGATMVQVRLREESIRTIVEVTRALVNALGDVPVLVSTRADAAMAAGAAGVHLAVGDVSPEAVRRFVPDNFLIGASVGDADDVERTRGADYVAVGPVFRTSSGTGGGAAMGIIRLQELASRCALPVVAVGGISAENAKAVIDAGSMGVAVMGGVFSSPDPHSAACALRAALDGRDANGT